MATYEFNDQIKFLLPAGFVVTREEDDEWPYTKECSKEFLWSVLVDE